LSSRVFKKTIVMVYAIFLSIYLFSGEFSLTSTITLTGIIVLIALQSLSRMGCSIFLSVPFSIIAMVIFTTGAEKLPAKESLAFIMMFAAIVLIISEKLISSGLGVFLLGIALAINPILGVLMDIVAFLLVLLGWLLIHSQEIPLRILILLVLASSTIILFTENLEISPTAKLLEVLNTTNTATAVEGHLTNNHQIPISSKTGNSIDIEHPVNAPEILNAHKSFEDKLSDFVVLLLLIVGASTMLVLYARATRIKGFWNSLIIVAVVFVLVLSLAIMGFMYLREQPDKPVFGAAVPNEQPGYTGAPSANLNSQPIEKDNKEKGIEDTVPLIGITLRSFLTIGTVIVGVVFAILLFSFLIRILKEKKEKEQPEEAPEEIPEGIILYPLDEVPAFSPTVNYILGAYWWLRRKYYSGFHHLTPYELLEKEKESDFEKNLKLVTELYVLVKYAGRKPLHRDLESFHKNLLKIVNALSENKEM